jgi:tRNA uridine 5-carboxymethylaminomethyl modification enzyme
MMTSRAEYRLLLRQDNADLRLTKKGYEIGLISQERYHWVCEKEQLIEEEIRRVNEVNIGANEKVQTLLATYGSIPLSNGTKLCDLIRRPELDYDKLAPIDPKRPALVDEVREQVNILIKYEGYINRQITQVRKFKNLENKKLPEDFDYNIIAGLRIEARQKLNEFQPLNIGQASRISGVTPADISVLLVFLEQINKNNS